MVADVLNRSESTSAQLTSRNAWLPVMSSLVRWCVDHLHRHLHPGTRGRGPRRGGHLPMLQLTPFRPHGPCMFGASSAFPGRQRRQAQGQEGAAAMHRTHHATQGEAGRQQQLC